MHYFEKSNLKMNGLYIVYNAGSMYENQNHKGTMHLMEHLICKRLDDMQDEFTKRNVEFNAYTTEEIVVVFVRGLNTELNNDLKTRIVKRMTDGIFVTEDDFNKEKDVVLQEYYNYFNEIAFGSVINNIRKKYNNYSVIGDAKDIANFTYADSQNIFNTFFKHPTNIIEVGRDKSDFSFVEYNDVPLTKKHLKYGNYNNEEEIIPYSETNSVVIATTTKCITKKDYPYLMILNTILSDGLNSPLYQELREKRGLVYGIMPYNMRCVNDTVFMYVAMTTKANAEEVLSIMKNIFTNLDEYVTHSRFSDVINSYKIQKDIDNIFKYKNPQMINKGLPTNFKTKKQLDAVTLDEVLNIGKKYFNDAELIIK